MDEPEVVPAELHAVAVDALHFALDALRAAPSAAEVLARPQQYEKWYLGVRKEALREP